MVRIAKCVTLNQVPLVLSPPSFVGNQHWCFFYNGASHWCSIAFKLCQTWIHVDFHKWWQQGEGMICLLDSFGGWFQRAFQATFIHLRKVVHNFTISMTFQGRYYKIKVVCRSKASLDLWMRTTLEKWCFHQFRYLCCMLSCCHLPTLTV
jgi:hypothetical protein